MNIKKIHFHLFSIVILTILFSCQGKKTTERNISVSILPQKYFIERIAGDYVQVNVMIPPGMNPATCDLSTEQLKKLYDSDICFAIGYLPFETTHLYPALQNQKNIQLVKHSDQLELIPGSCNHHHEDGHEHEGGIDPHVWLSPRYAKAIAGEMLSVLSARYPEQKAVFESNFATLEKDIDQVAENAEKVLAEKEHKTFMIYHPALTYFAHDYGMEQIPIEYEGKEPTPAYLKKMVDTVQEKDIHIIFIQKQFDVNNAQSIARQTGAEIIPIDPLNENWLEEMTGLIQILRNKLH